MSPPHSGSVCASGDRPSLPYLSAPLVADRRVTRGSPPAGEYRQFGSSNHRVCVALRGRSSDMVAAISLNPARLIA